MVLHSFLESRKLTALLLLAAVVGILFFSKGHVTGFQTADATPPVIFSLAHTPPTTPTVGYPVNFVLEAKDNVRVTTAEIYVDNQKVKTCSNPPSSPCTYWTTYWQVGKHSYYAKAYDAAGNSVRSPVTGSITFQVQAQNALPKGADIHKPSVSVTVKSLRTDANIPVDITATANDNVKVKRIEIYVDDNLAMTCQATPCLFQKKYPNIGRAQYYYAKAYDTSGNFGVNPPSGQKWFRVTGSAPTLSVQVVAGYITFLYCCGNYYDTGIGINTTATTNDGLKSITTYYKNATDGKLYTQTCNFNGEKTGRCDLALKGGPTNGTIEYWGEATDALGNTVRDPASGAKTADCVLLFPSGSNNRKLYEPIFSCKYN